MAFRIIEYCIKSSYLPRKDLLSCQDSRGKNIVWETFNQKEVPGNGMLLIISFLPFFLQKHTIYITIFDSFVR